MNHPESHDLTALAYGLVDGEEREQLLEHLSECDACRASYDHHMDEQALVRDVILEDARSGEAEARALETTLAALKELDGAEPEGRVIQLPRTWQLVGEMAAALVVALGLFFLLVPERAEGTAPGNNPVARQPAAAVVSEGVAYVPGADGEWLEVSELPEDRWVLAGESGVTIDFLNDSNMEMEEGAVFQISYMSSLGGELVVRMLNGNGLFNSRPSANSVMVAAGDANFLGVSGASYRLACVNDVAMYAEPSVPEFVVWSEKVTSLNVSAQVLTGNVLYLPALSASADTRVLARGEGIEIDRSQVILSRAGARRRYAGLVFDLSDMKEQSRRFNLVASEIAVPQTTTAPLKGDRTKALGLLQFNLRERAVELDKRGRDLAAVRQIIVEVAGQADDGETKEFWSKYTWARSQNGVKIVMVIEKGEVRAEVEVHGAKQIVTAKSPDELRKMCPPDVQEMLKDLKIKADSEGRWYFVPEKAAAPQTANGDDRSIKARFPIKKK